MTDTEDNLNSLVDEKKKIEATSGREMSPEELKKAVEARGLQETSLIESIKVAIRRYVIGEGNGKVV